MNIQSIKSNGPHFAGIVSIGRTKMLVGKTFIDKPFEARKIVALPFSKTIWKNEGGNSFDTLNLNAKNILAAPFAKFSDNIKLIADKINLSHYVKVGNTQSKLLTIIGNNCKTLFNISNGSIYLGEKSSSILNRAKRLLYLGPQSESYVNKAKKIVMEPYSTSHKNTADFIKQKIGSYTDINESSLLKKDAGSYSGENFTIPNSLKTSRKIVQNDIKTDFVNMNPEK